MAERAFLTTIVSFHIVLFFGTVWPGVEEYRKYFEAAIRLNSLIFYIYIALFFMMNCIPCSSCVK